jgi:hypothetical protein
MGSLQRPHKWCDPTSMLVHNYHIILHLYYQMMFLDLYHKAKLKTKFDIKYEGTMFENIDKRWKPVKLMMCQHIVNIKMCLNWIYN